MENNELPETIETDKFIIKFIYIRSEIDKVLVQPIIIPKESFAITTNMINRIDIKQYLKSNSNMILKNIMQKENEKINENEMAKIL